MATAPWLGQPVSARVRLVFDPGVQRPGYHIVSPITAGNNFLVAG